MDFREAFFEIDTDHSGEITTEELVDYMRKKNYKESFVERWLTIFDADNSGTISYDEYCQTLGLVPRQEDIEKMEAAKISRGEEAQPVDEGPIQMRRTKKVHAKPKPKQNKDGKGACRAADSRNSVISKRFGLMRFSKARVMEKKALYRTKPTSVRGPAKPKKNTTAAVTVTEKEVGGERNGGKRLVPSARTPRSVPTQENKRTRGRIGKNKCFSKTAHRLRPSIQPGTVLILLSGRHRGKRVIFLKQMKDTGLLLVTGPFKMNGCPLRRVNQRFVIATKTRLDLDDVALPERLTDEYFRRAKRTRKNKDEGDIYQKDDQKYTITSERKEDQKTVDAAVLTIINQHEDSKALRGYLRSSFYLKSGDRPHAMQF